MTVLPRASACTKEPVRSVAAAAARAAAVLEPSELLLLEHAVAANTSVIVAHAIQAPTR
jgi:hypothetical protein